MASIPLRNATRSPKVTASPARQLAHRVLVRIECDCAFANLALSAALRKTGLAANDRALVTDLVYGVCRRLNTLDWFAQQHSNRPLDSLKPAVRALLRLAAYESLFRSREHAFVVGSQYTELARTVAHEGVARFVNAICRKLTSSPPQFPPLEASPLEHLTLAHSHPRWLVERWLPRFGVEACLALCRANNTPSPVTIRVNTLKTTMTEAEAALQRAGVTVKRGDLHALALRVDGGALDRMPGFADGWFVAQSEASMLIAEALQPLPGETVMDACAAPGGKTTHLAALMDNRGSVLAVEQHASRARALRSACARAGASNVDYRVADFRVLARSVNGQADRCLLDAPCSGTGALRRKPDLRWRLQPEHLAELTKLQGELLDAAACVLKREGVLVYSTCSMEPEENEEVLHRFLAGHDDFETQPLDFLPVPCDHAGFVRTSPATHDTDGMFIARLRRRK